LRSPETLALQPAPLWPLIRKELWGVVGGRALWAMLLLVCPLIGYSYFQAVSLYAEASAVGQQSVVLTSLSPLDGVLVPTFGAFYVAVTLLFPFVAIRVLGIEKETGALSLLVQLPYRPATLVAVKLLSILAAWLIVSMPVMSTLLIWKLSGGHLALAETANLVLGHLIYGMLVGAIALFAATVAESSATAAIIALAFTIGSWVLDFTLAGQPGWLDWVARLSLTQVLRGFELGLMSLGLVVGVLAIVGGFAALAGIWLPPGTRVRRKLLRSGRCIAAIAAMVVLATQIGFSLDMTEDRRNSFARADQNLLATLTDPLAITVHLAPEDPRYVDLQRNVLAKLERTMPNVSVRLAGARSWFAVSRNDESYGEVTYRYGARTDSSRSTSPREILPLIYGLAGLAPPPPVPGADYPGYPLIADGLAALVWLAGILPLVVMGAWWWSRRPTRSIALQQEVRP
jgi:ABC-2 type transport system permease protein